MRKTKTILLFILVLSTFLRLWNISKVPVSMYIDELDVGYQAFSILKTGKDYFGNSWPLHFQSLAEWRTPFYIYAAVPTVFLFGISSLGVRLPAVIFGVLSILGMYLLVKELYRFTDNKSRNHGDKTALVAALVMAVSPWHIQYSRIAFDGPGLIPLLLFGLYFFFRSLPIGPPAERTGRQGPKDGRLLWVSVVFLALTPWVYSTAKLFTPLLFFTLLVVWKREILSISKKYLIAAAIAGFIVGVPIYYDTINKIDTQRFSQVSVFTDPTVGSSVNYLRERAARYRGEKGLGLVPSFRDKVFYNKAVLWGERITTNYLKAMSFDFLFINGDPNLRHSVSGMGQFYKIESIALLAGIILLLSKFRNKKIKYFFVLWILISIMPSALTRNGGNHATRLLLMLPPLIFLISFGVVEGLSVFKNNLKILAYITYAGIWIISIGFYLQNYFVAYPWDSERYWNAGWKEAIGSVQEIEANYDKIVFSMTEEPAWIFFASYYEYPPYAWQNEFPVGNDEFVDGFGEISNTGKYYFGSHLRDRDLGDYVNNKLLYLATRKDVDEHLMLVPEKIPVGLELIKTIYYPSGEPVFYLFSGL